MIDGTSLIAQIWSYVSPCGASIDYVQLGFVVLNNRWGHEVHTFIKLAQDCKILKTEKHVVDKFCTQKTY